ncbi:MAG: N-acetylglutaminylglutamine amidotransferase [Acidimicrobiales bacterium]|nr:N-acetylglutaminylglutamine amidotransferase [Acidimicrobiales bacterium]
MCGIAGEVRRAGERADVAAVDAMATRLESRGPDGSGVWASGPIAFAHRRLAIIDLSEAAAQPFHRSDLGLTVTFNGCIYNYEALRAELVAGGYTFSSHGDTEVILAGYHRWGTAVVDRLVGMFAFAVAERDSGRVVLARDRLGIKPLYLADVDGALRFASTLPALVAGGGVDTSIDPVALHHYLSLHSVVPAPRTILTGVRRLDAGTVMTVEPDGGRSTHRYWEAARRRRDDLVDLSADEWRDALGASLRQAVRRRLVADVPVGVLLSGGLDSSLIVGLLAELGQDRLSTFSIGFESAGEIEGDEFRYSDVVAERFDTDHHRLRIPTDDLVPALRDAIGAMSEPMVSHDVVAFSLLSQVVSRHVKVVQSGQGADEVFAGYHWYPPLVDADDDGASAYREGFVDRPHAAMSDLVDGDWLADHDVTGELIDAHFARPGADTAVDRALRLDTEVMLVEDPVKRVDNMTMAWGLEARVPFLDHDLVELAGACPPELLLDQGGKGVLKEVARQVIPQEVIDRPKGYFPVPALTHLDGEVLEMVRGALYAPEAKARGLFRPDAVDRLLQDPNAALTPLGGNPLWQIGLLELWLQRQGIR